MDVEIKTMDLSFCGEVAQNVVNKEDQLEVEVSIRNYYLNNLVEKEVVKILS